MNGRTCYGAFLSAHLSGDEWEALSEEGQAATYERLTVELMRDEVIPLLRRHGIGVDFFASI